MKIENSLSFRLHKIGTLYVFRTDGQTDERTNGVERLLDLLSPSATQVTIITFNYNRQSCNCLCTKSSSFIPTLAWLQDWVEWTSKIAEMFKDCVPLFHSNVKPMENLRKIPWLYYSKFHFGNWGQEIWNIYACTPTTYFLDKCFTLRLFHEINK